MLEALPWDSAPRFLIRDRDGCYRDEFRLAVRDMNIQEVLTTPHSPRQNGFVKRLIGSIRRECLDHMVVLNESSLRKILLSYFRYYERSRTHLALGKDAPETRAVHPPTRGKWWNCRGRWAASSVRAPRCLRLLLAWWVEASIFQASIEGRWFFRGQLLPTRTSILPSIPIELSTRNQSLEATYAVQSADFHPNWSFGRDSRFLESTNDSEVARHKELQPCSVL